MIFCGVLQGCPLSGVIFAWRVDPFLAAMNFKADSKHVAITRVCADDVGAPLRRIEALLACFEVFEVARKVSGFTFNRRTCALVPVSGPSGSIWCR